MPKTLVRMGWRAVVIFAFAASTLVAQPFTQVSTNLPGLWWGHLTWGDYDNDGRPDLQGSGLAANASSHSILYHNEGSGVFTEIETNFPGMYTSSGEWGDYDRDGNLDLLLVRFIFRNLGNGAFTNVTTLGPQYGDGVTWGDYDNDGDLDIAKPGGIYRNDGSNQFLDIGAPLPAVLFGSVNWVDADNDSYLDLLTSGTPGGQSYFRRLYHNNGNGSFTDLGLGFQTRGSAAWGDFDNDGDMDLLVAYGEVIYRNDGSNNFVAINSGLPGNLSEVAVWGDFDNDGYLDVLVTGDPYYGLMTRLYRNNHNGTFSDTGLALLGASKAALACADMDNDGDLDFALSGNPSLGTAILRIYRNDVVAKNPKPNAPTGLVAIVTNSAVTLSWNAAVDTNQAAGLNYNFRIGTAPGKSDLFDPTANLATGSRKLAAIGNNSGRLSRGFTNWPAGIYYWSVQAIDHCHVGSSFAPESTFMVAKPTISYISDQTIFPEISTFIPFTVTATGTSVETLAIGVVATDTNLLPASAFLLTGSSPNRTLVITPPRNQRGTTTVTMTATDTNGVSVTRSFVVEVRHTFTDAGVSFPEGGFTVWGDYNNDGFPDVLSTAGMRLFRNNTNGTFTEVPAGLPSLSGDAAWGDFDNDGWLDLALTGATGFQRLTVIMRNKANGTFTNINAGLPGLYGTTAWGDYDNDGDLDLLIGGDTGFAFSNPELYRNDGGVFTAAQAGLPMGGFTSQAWGDYNLDGRLDILLEIANQTGIFQNNGNGTFSNINANIPKVNATDPTWGDFDNDGYLDVVYTGSGETRLYRNNHDGTFTNINAGLLNLTSSGLAWGDFDNDGWSDLVLTGTTDGNNPWFPTLLYHNNGDGTFSDHPVELPSGYVHARWVDYDLDDDLDLLVLRTISNIPMLYRNETPRKNTRPTPPTGLVSSVSISNSVIFVWSPASDAETTNATGLSYNLRVGRTPGGIEILSPQADVNSGQRRLAQRGNGSSTNFWLISELPPGDYFWSVQAIDPAFAGSAFSPEASFSITNGRPTLSALVTQTVSHSVLSPTIPIVIGDRETPASNLIVTALSSNTNRLANEQIFLGGTGSNRTVQLRPATNDIGPVAVTLVVMDGAGASRSFSLWVNVTNLPPYAGGLSNLSILPGAVVPAIPIQVGDPESSPDQLTITAYSSNTNFVADTNLLCSGSGSNRFLQIVPTPEMRGTTLVRVIFKDPLGAASTNSFTFRVAGFAPIASGLPEVQQGAVDWGDFDNDNDLDVLICGRLANATAITRIYRNDGPAGLTDLAAGLPGVSSTSPPTAAWGDYDGDGDLDFLLAGGGLTRVYRNNNNGTFTDIVAGLPVSTSGAWCDYDNDGDLDLILCSSAATRIYRNPGNGTFTNSGIALPASTLVAIADYDNDGDADLALAGGMSESFGSTVILRNEGSGAFTNINAGLQGVSPGSLAWGDSDQDGRLDLLLTGDNGNGVFTRLYHNNSSNTFSVVATNLPSVSSGAAVWGDYDNDGQQDILLTGLTIGRNGGRVARIYRNTDGGMFADIGEPLVGAYWSAATWSDYDGNGSLDLLYCGTTNGLSNGSGTALCQNRSVVSNSPPNSPTGLTVLPNWTLSWDPASDLETTNSVGLTYNLRIGTNSGGSQIMSAHANLATGARRVARFGNVGPVNHWPAKLPHGTYYWSVQAIDTGFAGSAFAPEQSFTIPNRAPVAVGQSLTTAEDTSKAILLAATDADGDPISYSIVNPPIFGTLTGTPPNVSYVPATNYFGFDQFGFQANDPYTNSTLASVYLQVTPVKDVNAVKLAGKLLNDAGLQLTFNGEPWKSYRIEASEDLTQWVTLTNLLCTNLIMQLIDSDARMFRQRFYRSVEFAFVPSVTAPTFGTSYFSFTLIGLAGRNYQVQASTNLQDWTILTNVFMTGQSGLFLDGAALNFEHRFYRVIGP